jgi:hypothetical protein
MSAWTGIIIGGVAGGLLGFAATKFLLKSKTPDVGVIGAAAAAGALAGGALTATPATAATSPTLHMLSLAHGDTTIATKIGDVVDLLPAAGLTVTAIDAHGSDAVVIASVNPATVNAVKLGGALLAVTLSDASKVNVKVTVAA